MRYYDSEIRYLKEAAEEFAQKFPDLARQPGIDSESLKTDESVEQLFQGFAFMMAQVRRKIDDDIPELTEPLRSHLLPVVNRTLPSTAVVELTPHEPDPVRETRLPAGQHHAVPARQPLPLPHGEWSGDLPLPACHCQPPYANGRR